MRPEKISMTDEVKSRVTDAVFVIMTDYRGLTVAKTQDLRSRLREADASFHVVRNTMIRRVASELAMDGLDSALTGPSAMVVGNGDVVQTTKILKNFIKENQLPTIKIGTLDGVILSAEDVEKLAGLPSRETLLAQVVGTIAAPMTQLVGVMQQKAASILYVLKAIQDKKEQQQA